MSSLSHRADDKFARFLGGALYSGGIGISAGFRLWGLTAALSVWLFILLADQVVEAIYDSRQP